MSFLFANFQTITGLPEIFAYIFILIFGCLVGSFLNVVIHRVPLEESVVFPNSACPKCKKPIKPYDNIPILSWLILGGKCRNCKEKISARYPAVELLNGLLWVLVYSQIGFNPFLPVCLIFVTTMVSLIFIDAEHMILPDVINFPLLFFALLVRVLFPIFLTAEYFSDLKFSPLSSSLKEYPVWLVSLFGAILGGLVGGGFLWLMGKLWKLYRGIDAMGLGDVKMMFAVGALLGWRLTLLSIFLSAFAGSIIGIFVIIRKKDLNLQAKLPFGIFLGIGSILSLLFGEKLINWYIQSFLP
ncbi:MAG TPA: prepilin peptidase [Pyrinomonadaceae bacterium]|nr:prepilin peptidase [Pyrinomonadaceae bacterium]